jgi:pantoate kinase
VRGGELIIPPGTGIGVSDVLDLAEVVDETLSEQPIDTILGSELTRVLGIDDEQATRLAEAFGATTVQQLLRNPAFGRLLRLAQTVGVRPA